MVQNNSSFAQIRKIDNSRRWVPFATLFLIIVLIVIAVWFIKGGSFKLYASLFFGLYFLTRQAWVSIILVSIVQNILFLPFRVIGSVFHVEMQNFETELKKTKEDSQSILLRKKVSEGNFSIIFYILNFVLLAIAFFSAGRVFLLDFYHHNLNTAYLYSFIPYPTYPLTGTIFYFPFFKITETIALDTKTILLGWGVITGVLVALRLSWRFILKFFFSKNKQILKARFKYNRLLVFISGFTGTLFVASFFLLRHIPVGFQGIFLTADISQKNTVFNIITATCTFLVTVYAGYTSNKAGVKEAHQANIPQNIIEKVSRNNMKTSLRNAFFLSIAAYLITHQMPCSHDLSVLSFEAVYLIFPHTLDRFLGIAPKRH